MFLQLVGRQDKSLQETGAGIFAAGRNNERSLTVNLSAAFTATKPTT
jgi:hypothetical protein